MFSFVHGRELKNWLVWSIIPSRSKAILAFKKSETSLLWKITTPGDVSQLPPSAPGTIPLIFLVSLPVHCPYHLHTGTWAYSISHMMLVVSSHTFSFRHKVFLIVACSLLLSQHANSKLYSHWKCFCTLTKPNRHPAFEANVFSFISSRRLLLRV